MENAIKILKEMIDELEEELKIDFMGKDYYRELGIKISALENAIENLKSFKEGK